MKKIKIYRGFALLAETSVEFESYLIKLDRNEPVIFDWETTGLEYNAMPLILAIHQKDEDPIVVPVRTFFDTGLPMEEIARICNKHFGKFKLVAHNAKYDSMINVMNGIKDENVHIHADTITLIHLVDENLDKNLEKCVKRDFGFAKESFKEISGKAWDKIDWFKEGNSLLELLAGYAAEDVYFTTKLYYKYYPKLDEYTRLIHDSIEIPTVKILRDAKIRGVLIDKELLLDMAEKARKEVKEITEEIYAEAGCVFNLNSPKQKIQVFFDKMKLPPISKTKTGALSTDAETAEAWADMGYSIGKLLIKYSEINKLLSGYLDAIPKLVDEHNILRGDMNSCGTVGARMSSSAPNLQNQPNNDSYPVRQAFIPRPGYVFINRDYSQLELRIIAHICDDKNFQQTFNSGGDPHTDTGLRLGIPRKHGKTANFSIIYGIGAEKFAKKLGITVPEAKRIIEVDYFRVYDGFAAWKKRVENEAHREGQVRNLFGRIRHLPAAKNSMDRGKYYSALRQAVNTPIQSTGGDIVKMATIMAVNKLSEEGIDAHFLIQVHDEILFEVRQEQMIQAEKIITECMENVVKLVVPLTTDGKIILHWGEMKDDSVLSLTKRFDYSLLTTLLI